MATKKHPPAPPLTPDEAKRMLDQADQAISKFRGGADELESALGAYLLGRHVGWKVLYLIHSKKTVAKYEAILGVRFREEFPEEGPMAGQSMAFAAAQAFTNFWKVVSGEQKLPLERDERKALK